MILTNANDNNNDGEANNAHEIDDDDGWRCFPSESLRRLKWRGNYNYNGICFYYFCQGGSKAVLALIVCLRIFPWLSWLDFNEKDKKNVVELHILKPGCLFDFYLFLSLYIGMYICMYLDIYIYTYTFAKWVIFGRWRSVTLCFFSSCKWKNCKYAYAPQHCRRYGEAAS